MLTSTFECFPNLEKVKESDEFEEVTFQAISENFWHWLDVAWVLPQFNKWPHLVNVQHGIMVAQHLYGWGKHLKLHDQTRQQHVQTIVQFLSKECLTMLLCLFLLSWHCGLVDKDGKGCWVRQDRTETNRRENNQLKVRQAGDLKAWLTIYWYSNIDSENDMLVFKYSNIYAYIYTSMMGVPWAW